MKNIVSARCSACGREFQREAYYLKRCKRIFCSLECRYRGTTGALSPRWRGGKPYIAEGYVVFNLHAEDGYRRHIREHVLIAQKALGKPLPKGAEVHHVNGDRSNNSPSNLVICPNHAYHALLHARVRVRDAGGNPDSQKICCSCADLLDFGQFHRASKSITGRRAYCKKCKAERDSRRSRARAS